MLRCLLLVLPLCGESSKIFVPGQDRRAIRHLKVTDASPTRVALKEINHHPYFDNNAQWAKQGGQVDIGLKLNKIIII